MNQRLSLVPPNALAATNKCRVCKRTLKSPDAIARGVGPVCARKLGIFKDTSQAEMDMTLSDDETGDIIIEKNGAFLHTNVPHVWKAHSPTGYGIGYGGSGPADLALNILLKVGLTRDEAWGLHQDFKWKFISTLPQEGGRIARGAIQEWIKDQKEI